MQTFSCCHYFLTLHILSKKKNLYSFEVILFYLLLKSTLKIIYFRCMKKKKKKFHPFSIAYQNKYEKFCFTANI
jgi:hypothetical protein